MSTLEKSTEDLFDASNKVGLELNTKKRSNYLCLVTRILIKIYNITMAYASFRNVAKFKCLGTIATNQNLAREETRTD
jgi:hypothetical protein